MMLSALKKEILDRKRTLEDNQLIGSEKKFFKRSELNALEESLCLQDNSSKNEDLSTSVLCNFKNSDDIDDSSILPRAEVIRRLRDREEPILLFSETELDSFRRLRHLEILEPEVNRGFRNDFQEALERVDQAYLSEILKSEKGDDSSKDVALTGENITMEGVIRLAKDLGRGNHELDCKVILQFIQLLLQLWGSRLNSRSEAEKMSVTGKMEAATYTQTQCYLKPLTKRLKKHKLPEDILDSLTEIVRYCLRRDYVKANDSYLQMAIGNAPWPIGVTMVGIHARTGREKIFSKHVAHVLNDETQRKYIQGLKRLMTKCQSFFSAAPSKCVEYNAL